MSKCDHVAEQHQGGHRGRPARVDGDGRAAGAGPDLSFADPLDGVGPGEHVWMMAVFRVAYPETLHDAAVANHLDVENLITLIGAGSDRGPWRGRYFRHTISSSS
jgi:hypothetical protein